MFETCRKLRVTKYRISSSSTFGGDPIGSWHALPAAPQLSLFSVVPHIRDPGFLPERSAFTTQNEPFRLCVRMQQVQNACPKHYFVDSMLTYVVSSLHTRWGALLRKAEIFGPKRWIDIFIIYKWDVPLIKFHVYIISKLWIFIKMI